MPERSPPLTREQRRLAELLLRQRGLSPAQLPIPRRLDDSRASLSSTQHRLWTSARSAGGTAYDNVPMAFRIRGSLNVESFARALSLVIERHEILRTTFPVEETQSIQRIHPAAPVTIDIEDLRTMPAAERERRLATRVEEEARRPFDPSMETLFRATAFRLDSSDWGLVLVSHHLATDGWGARLLLDELSSIHRALADGREPDLPPLAVQYGDYAEWEAEQLERGELESQRATGEAAALRGVHPPELYRWRLEGYPTERDDWYLRPIVDDLRTRDVRRLQTYTLVSSSLGGELRAAGFRQREQGIRFIARPCSPGGRSLLESGVDWEITDLDCDRGLDR